MKRLALFTAALAASVLTFDSSSDPARPWRLTFAAPAHAYGRSVIQFSFFFDSLRPYGHWAKYQPYGWVFIPRVSLGWRPYTLGRWTYSARYGWLWVSDEPFGWATFHYGWWDYDPRWGWFWVPGYDWAPSWVVWRSGFDFIGWAPIPAHFVWGRHYYDVFDRWDDRYSRNSNAWCFTRKRNIGARHAAQVIVPVQQNITYINQSTTVYNTTIVNQTIVNRGIDVAALEREAGTSVPRAEINAVDVPPARATAGEGPQGVVVNAFQPDPSASVAPSEVAAEPESQSLPAELESVAAIAPVLEPTVPGPTMQGPTEQSPAEVGPDNGPTAALPPPAPDEAPTPAATESAPGSAIGPEPEPGYTPPAEASLPPADEPAMGSLPGVSPLPEPSAAPPVDAGLPPPPEEPSFPAAPQAMPGTGPEPLETPPAEAALPPSPSPLPPPPAPEPSAVTAPASRPLTSRLTSRRAKRRCRLPRLSQAIPAEPGPSYATAPETVPGPEPSYGPPPEASLPSPGPSYEPAPSYEPSYTPPAEPETAPPSFSAPPEQSFTPAPEPSFTSAPEPSFAAPPEPPPAPPEPPAAPSASGEQSSRGGFDRFNSQNGAALLARRSALRRWRARRCRLANAPWTDERQLRALTCRAALETVPWQDREGALNSVLRRRNSECEL